MSDFIRAVALDDIRIRSGGTGRTVEAYCAIFNEEAEIVDQDGHYLEVNHPASFNRTIQRHQGGFPVVYNHGVTLAGTPSDRGSVPIGVSTEVRVDARGVLTVSEYGTSELADEVLEMIRMGAIKAQSYGGKFTKSDPTPPRSGFRRDLATGRLRTVTRLEVLMREFGPTPFPAFAGAAITGVRAQQLLGALLTAPADQRVALLNQMAPPLDEADPADLETDGPPATDSADTTEDTPSRPSARSLASRIRAARVSRGME